MSRLLALFAAIGALAGIPSAWAVTGAIDPSFGDSGRVFTDFGGYDSGRALAIQPDGRIVAGGGGGTMARYLPNGTLDASFGTGGKRIVDASFDIWFLTLQADGKIVGAGYRGGSELIVFRTDTAGNLDPTFAGTGFIATTARGGGLNRPSNVFVQPDGKIVFVASSANSHYLARYLPDGTPDPSYNGTGIAVASPNDGDIAGRSAMLPDGRIVIAGRHGFDLGVVRYGLDGSREMLVTHAIQLDRTELPYAVALQADGGILVGMTLQGFSGPSTGAIARLLPDGSLDPTFGTAGRVLLADIPVHLVALPGGKILALAILNTLLMRFNADGSVDTGFHDSGRMQPTLAPGGQGGFVTLARQSDGRVVALGTVSINAAPADFGLMRIDLDAVPFLFPLTTHFGGQSMTTTSLPRTLTITNATAAPITIGSIASGSEFPTTHACTVLQPGATCPVEVRFTPNVYAVPVNSWQPVSGSLTVTSDAPGSPHSIVLSGNAERSMVAHFYQAILRRLPDPAGQSFWMNEGFRVTSQFGADVNETAYAMSQVFFGSPEYLNAGRGTADYVRDLYRTFFNREADDAGLTYWYGQISAGMPAEVVLTAFDFSPEFRAFSRRIFGDPTSRAEVDMVMDFYRGLLGRLPDFDGFNAWRQRFRAAQCGGPATVAQEAEAISSAFARSPEYAARARNNARYVADLYNAFMRRGGDLDGVKHWIGQLDSGAITREDARRAFVASVEFQARVQAVISQGCN
jgi:uncharacterized delta-60 repeat protein